MTRRVVVTSIVVFLAAAGYVGWHALQWSLRAKQVRTCATLYSLSVAVDEYRQKFGIYPGTLQMAVAEAPWSAESKSRLFDLRDAWGQPFHYSRRNADFLLISYGRGGRPSGTVACASFETDVFATAKGVERCCGK